MCANLISSSASGQTPYRTPPPPIGQRVGQLVVVGSGIRAIGQFTLEAQAHIRQADKILYSVNDPATEMWIREQNPNSVDLSEWYANDKARSITYVQMAELILAEVRKGLNVVAVFYGHPGVFVNPSHRALAIAREEGFPTRMIPAVSSLDCLFADLDIDPSYPGCQILGATDLLLRRRTLLSDGHVILLQVGAVGDYGFSYAGFVNINLPKLVEYLQKTYGQDYEVVNYIATQFPTARSEIEPLKLSQILEPAIARHITALSTFYIPPKSLRPNDLEMGSRLGLQVPSSPSVLGPLHHGVAYSEEDRQAVAAIDSHTLPEGYCYSRASREMYSIIRDLALDPNLAKRFADDPESFLRSRNLTADEAAALISGHPGKIWTVMKLSSQEMARRCLRRVLSDPVFTMKYVRTLQDNYAKYQGDADIRRWLREAGYDITPTDLMGALNEKSNQELGFWSCQYRLFLNGSTQLTLTIDDNTVTLDGVVLKNVAFQNATMSWTEMDNDSSGSLRFVLQSDDNAGSPGQTSYIGPQCYGLYWKKGGLKPTRPNVYGKIGVTTRQSDDNQLMADDLSVWSNVYSTYIKSDEDWFEGKQLIINANNSDKLVAYDGKPISTFTMVNNTLAWLADDADGVAAALIFLRTANDNPVFVGKIYNRDERPPLAKDLFGQPGSCRAPMHSWLEAKQLARWKINGERLYFVQAAVLFGHAVWVSAEKLTAFFEAKINGATGQRLEELDRDWEAARGTALRLSQNVERIAEVIQIGVDSETHTTAEKSKTSHNPFRVALGLVE